jgi:hypothetical protein
VVRVPLGTRLLTQACRTLSINQLCSLVVFSMLPDDASPDADILLWPVSKGSSCCCLRTLLSLFHNCHLHHVHCRSTSGINQLFSP